MEEEDNCEKRKISKKISSIKKNRINLVVWIWQYQESETNKYRPGVRNKNTSLYAFLHCQKQSSLFPSEHSIFSSSRLNIFLKNMINLFVCIWQYTKSQATSRYRKSRSYTWKHSILCFIALPKTKLRVHVHILSFLHLDKISSLTLNLEGWGGDIFFSPQDLFFSTKILDKMMNKIIINIVQTLCI